jgi:hypothetical protein
LLSVGDITKPTNIPDAYSAIKKPLKIKCICKEYKKGGQAEEPVLVVNNSKYGGLESGFIVGGNNHFWTGFIM